MYLFYNLKKDKFLTRLFTIAERYFFYISYKVMNNSLRLIYTAMAKSTSTVSYLILYCPYENRFSYNSD